MEEFKQGQKDDNQIVVFRLGDELFSIPIDKVKEIVKITPITMIPQTPDFVAGVMNLRGTIIPVIDLRRRFGFSPREADKETRIILVNNAGQVNGLIVDGVREVTTLDGKTLQPPGHISTAVDQPYIEGVYAGEGELVIQLKIEEIIPR